MSNLPPPTPGGPAFQPEQPTTAFNPLPPINAPAPKKRSKRLFVIIGAAVVVVAALVVVGLLVFGGDDDGDKVDTKTASGAVEDVTDAASLDSSTHAALLKECPFDGVDDLAAGAPKGFDADGAAGGDDQALVTQSAQKEDPPLLQCSTATDDLSLGFGVVAAAQPPTGLQDYINRSLTDATGKFEHTSSFRGGTLLPFCTEPKEGSGQLPLCATVWYDKQLLTGIFTRGDVSSTDVTTAWVKEDLDDLINDLENADADRVEVTQTAGFDIDSAKAAANLTKVIDAANVDGTAGTSAPQDSCLFADMDALLTSAPAGLDQSQVSGVAVDAQIASALDDGDPSLFQCLRANDDQSSMYGVFIAAAPPADFKSYAKRSSGATSVQFADDDGTPLRGGTLHAYCGSDNGAVTFCESDWVSDDLQVGVFANFDGVTAADTTTWLTANLDVLIASIEAADATAVTPAAG